MQVETSESRPITVSWILRPELGLSGSEEGSPAASCSGERRSIGHAGAGWLGLCFCPGKRHVRGGKRLERSLESDLQRLKDNFHVEVIVCLLNDAELRVRVCLGDLNSQIKGQVP